MNADDLEILVAEATIVYDDLVRRLETTYSADQGVSMTVAMEGWGDWTEVSVEFSADSVGDVEVSAWAGGEERFCAPIEMTRNIINNPQEA